MTEATAPAGEPVYLKATEVAERLNISVRHVYDLISSRELESSRFGRGRHGLRVTSKSLADFEIRSRETSTP